jgi:signal transduction histidine kinase
VGTVAGSTPAATFAALVRDGRVDGAIVLDGEGRVVFPTLVSGERSGSADQQLLELQRTRPDAGVFTERARVFATALDDFGADIPPAQRLFLMSELRRVAPQVASPVEDALRLSIRLVERGPWGPGLWGRDAAGFTLTTAHGVYAIASGRTVALYTTDRLKTLVEATLAPHMPSHIHVVAHPAGGVAPGDGAIGAGATLPGWMISLADSDPSGAAAAHTNLLVRSWAMLIGIGLLGYLGVVAVQRLRRQQRVARLKTDLTAAVSHELRAPLASIQVLVDGLLADKELDPVKTREYLRLIAGEQGRLGRVIENFLSFARLERGGKRFDLVPTNPAAVVRSGVEAVRDRMPPGGDLRVEIAEDLPQVLADADALETALINLLDNAIKFSPAEKRLEVRAYTDGPSVVLSVRDNGPGIAEAEHGRIFRRFYRVDQRLASETAGVGLGLSIVAMIAAGHEGEVTVSSAPGAGSTFSIRLPALARPTR